MKLCIRKSINLAGLAANAILNAFYISPDDWSLLDGQINMGNSGDLLIKLERAKNIRQLIINTMGIPNLPLV